MTIYFNFHLSNHIVETIDQISDKDFPNYKEFISEKNRLLTEYRRCIKGVYLSQRCTKEWRNK
jgi:hypothetical protein